MNQRYLRPCRRIGCNNLTREKYCEEHIYIETEKKVDRNKYYDRNIRDRKTTDFYNSDDWIKKREYVLSIFNGIDLYDYYVNKEITIANTVHHIVEIKEDWDKRLDDDNLFPTSESNHNTIHNLYKKDKEGTQRLLYELIERYRREFNISPLPLKL